VVERLSGPPGPSTEVALLAKRFDRAKSRLDLAPQLRSRLAAAMLLDTLAAVLPVAARVAVVTSEPDLASRLSGRLGAGRLRTVVIIDDPGELNRAVAAADRWFDATPTDPAIDLRIAMAADLPALTAAEFAAVTAEAAQHSRSFVADAAGTGTTLVAASQRSLLSHFGPGSAERHRSAGLASLTAGPGARHDVDTVADLAAAARLGVGPYTKALLPPHTIAETPTGPAPQREPCRD